MSITKELMEQYEAVRFHGSVNMWDVRGVRDTARANGLDILARVFKDDYMQIIGNYVELMEKFGIKRKQKH